ncbi:hypothetical protein BCR42DRAFT_456788 [Absidia repens]|uniref:Heterokaryon incompatibility domain-containing protein n=1 Tax=Absidia repens TaxID=90262 RepID=A0A1X2HZA4_9FUNG|nr:hypothetical protein BCR42DRAFT_456788 [Absidia repens]
MTSEDDYDHLGQDLSSNANTDTDNTDVDDEDYTPFDIVLVDLEKAANDNIIQCIERRLSKPSENQPIDYVALSYRWGELSETIIDTDLGYLATITSFDLDDFYRLCSMIRQEPDLHAIDYVWVDAICVDQTNPTHRKATIYRMSDIYAGARYVLAVPDLHLRHLAMTTSKNWEIVEATRPISDYLFHLIHGNTDRLAELDHAWLKAHANPTNNDSPASSSSMEARIAQRTQTIQTSMDFLSDLVRDWSSRVWVISECHIAKHTKHKLKYWFLQLSPSSPAWLSSPGGVGFFEFDFRDPTRSFLSTLLDDAFITNSHPAFHESIVACDAIYNQFHQLMVRQLDQPTFLEMMLDSKACKNEDRFYAVLPLSKYKHKLTTKDVVDSWQIHNTFSVKLKLFEWMTVEDKLTLLFLSGGQHSIKHTKVLPTFATTNIYWPENVDEYPTFPIQQEGGNFDLIHDHVLNLTKVQPKNTKENHGTSFSSSSSSSWLYKLTLKPITFYRLKNDFVDELCQINLQQNNRSAARRLGLLDTDDVPDIVCIPTHISHTPTPCQFRAVDGSVAGIVNYIFLVGSLVNNKWMLEEHFGTEALMCEENYTLHYCHEDYSHGFDIY